MKRRSFIKNSAMTTDLALSLPSYANVLGSNDQVNIAINRNGLKSQNRGERRKDIILKM